MGELSREAIILIVIVASGCSVVIAWAIHSIWHGRHNSDGEDVVGDKEQQLAAYRAEVRQRNHETIAATHGFKYPFDRYEEV